MNDAPSTCLICMLARNMAEEPDLQAVKLDPGKRRVSFACREGCRDFARIRRRLTEVVRLVEPDRAEDAIRDPWKAACRRCPETGETHPRTLPPLEFTRLESGGGALVLEKPAKEAGDGDIRDAWARGRWRRFRWVRRVARDTAGAVESARGGEWRGAMTAALVCGLATVIAFTVEKMTVAVGMLPLLFYGTAYLAGAWFPAIDVWELLRKRTADIHLLMLVVAGGAAVIGHWWEGAVLLFLFSLSGALEEMAMARTEREIDSLFKDAPKTARRLDARGVETECPVVELAAGMRIRVRPGDQFPVDARVVEGETAADESSLTGESLPVEKTTGDGVFSGTMNLWGRVDCEVLKRESESALSQVLRLIREARESKAPSQRFTDLFGARYTWAVLSLCSLMFFVWWLAFARTPPDAFYRTMTLLVVASPCALVISIPSAILAAIAAGARQGILFRGGASIETLAEIDRVALDKTGTLTEGNPHVVSVESYPPGREDDILTRAAGIARNSTHPVSRATVRKARQDALELPQVDGFRQVIGKGVAGRILADDGGEDSILLGRRSWFAGESAWVRDIPEPAAGVTENFVQCGDLRGRILLEDRVRPAAANLLKELKLRGLKVTMLTGDREEAALSVARQVDLDDFRAHLRPDEKVAHIRKWRGEGEKVAMVGDGVNDAPSLAAADVGVAMGARGSDAALEQADVVLMRDRLENFHEAYTVSRFARRILRQNIVISLAVIALLVCGALGAAIPLTLGVIGHEGSTVLVVLNSLRVLFHRGESPARILLGSSQSKKIRIS